MADSILPVLNGKVFDVLNAYAPLAGVSVYWGPNFSDETPERAIFIGGEEESDRERVLLAGVDDPPLDENFSTQLLVTVRLPDGRPLLPCYTAAHEIAPQVEAAIRTANPTHTQLGLAQPIFEMKFSKWKGTFAQFPNQKRGYQIEMTLSGHTRI